ncbi:hypothetical protein [Methanosarcina horonobensis]|uniref:hypothetical protein n=1 Tax=Methanosarcina horonobensis TaxID=418008 RepID=UPI00138E0D2A|nr:hypothetical protein [Methanosarcina horonobensis]
MEKRKSKTEFKNGVQKTKSKNKIQKWSPKLHVKRRKATSSGEVMRLQQVKLVCTGQISLGCTSTDTYAVSIVPVGVS